jgi:ferrochelatase
LLLSYGGPEGPDDVMPFLENVVRGKNVPRARLLEVARHYEPFGGVSPINAQNRSLLVALVDELNAHGPRLPVYWANRNWHPLLPDVLRQMTEDGVERALALVTSAFGSYPGCRQYQEDIQRARQEIGPEAPRIEKLRLFYNHPGFIEAMTDRVWDALEQCAPQGQRQEVRLIFTAHSIPVAMAASAPYESQLREACRLVAERLKVDAWDLVYQNRSGPPSAPWLVPDIRDHLRLLAAAGEVRSAVIAPIGFLSEHVEIVYDLDIEVQALCDDLGLSMVRSGVVGCHPRFVRMVRELVMERLDESAPRLAVGSHGPWPDQCPAGCCR